TTHQFHILDGLLLREGVRHCAALTVKLVEACVISAIYHINQSLAEIERIMDTAVHAKTAQRVIEVGRIADEEHTFVAERLGNALVNPVNRTMLRFDILTICQEAAKHARLL